MQTAGCATPAMRVYQETDTLRQALAERDLELALSSYAAMEELRPLRLLERATEGELMALLRPWIEAWDEVVQLWWLGPGKAEPVGGATPPWKALMLSYEGGFGFRQLGLLAWWLRLARSDRSGGGALPEDLRELGGSEQARALGRFCLRCDGTSPIDYAETAFALHPRLRPFWAWWFLAVHLVSPRTNVSDAVNANRRAAAESFIAFHREEEVPLPADFLLGQAGYRSVYFEEHPLELVRTLSDRILAPTFAPLVGRGRGSGAPRVDRGWKDCGVILTCFGEDHSVRRCVDPLLGELRRGGARGYFLDGTSEESTRRLPAEWRSEPVRLSRMQAGDPGGLAAAARGIRDCRLDFLFYPEVGLSNPSRWLSTQRLARVQASAYGHPVTTGSAAIDYFVGGLEMEDPTTAARRYRERLVLLPGLGAGAVPPPLPSVERKRPRDEAGAVRFASLASVHKLSASLLRSWDAVLGATGEHSEIYLMAGLPDAAARTTCLEIGSYLRPGRVTMVTYGPRLSCLNHLVEADVYLDSFPYAGFNSVIDALAVGLPVVTLDGEGPYRGCGAALLRRLDLPGFLIAKDKDSYVAAASRLAAEPALRAEIRAMLDRERVLEALCSDELEPHFAAAVRWMRQQGPRNPGPPVLIEAGADPRVLEG